MILNPNSDITIYNTYYDEDDEDIKKYQKTIIRDVNWQQKTESTVSDKGMLIANSTLIFMNKLDNYISPKKFLKLSSDERKNYFTLAPGDRIVKGAVDFIVTGRNPYSITNLEDEFDEVVSICTISKFPTHLEVRCK